VWSLLFASERFTLPPLTPPLRGSFLPPPLLLAACSTMRIYFRFSRFFFAVSFFPWFLSLNSGSFLLKGFVALLGFPFDCIPFLDVYRSSMEYWFRESCGATPLGNCSLPTSIPLWIFLFCIFLLAFFVFFLSLNFMPASFLFSVAFAPPFPLFFVL